jgi:histidinol dehydrogenase
MLKFDDMMLKVQPIIEDVHRQCDLVLIELMSKFDKAQLMETVIHPPFNASVMGIRQEV